MNLYVVCVELCVARTEIWFVSISCVCVCVCVCAYRVNTSYGEAIR